MNLEEIKELVQVVIDSGVAELEVTRGENKVRIRRNTQITTQEFVVPAHHTPMAAHHAPAHAAHPTAHPVAAPHPAEPEPEPPAAEENLEYVKSPIVGTFYEAPSPDSPPFVKVGDRVSLGQVLCIIESMKLMNEIEAETSGTIAARLVENGKPVEYGEALFSIRPE